MPVTLRDVAKRSGVSVSTTSRALNNRMDVSPEVRDRVRAAAHELNYTVNHHARVLKGAASKTLGLLLYNTESLTFNATLTRGIYDIATAQGFSLIVYNANADADTERRGHVMLRQNSVDGLLVNSVQSGAEPLRYLQEHDIPFVLLNRRVDGIECDYAVVDYRQGSYLAASHLLALGHRRILCQLATADHPPTVARLAGYRQAHAEHGVPFSPDLIVYAAKADEAYEPVRAAMQRITPRPTAIMAYNDENTLPILKALSDLNLRIPQDVSVVGHNDLSFARFLVPPLTSVTQSVHEMGKLGIEILLQKIRQPETQPWTLRQVVLEPKLTVRQSTAPPA